MARLKRLLIRTSLCVLCLASLWLSLVPWMPQSLWMDFQNLAPNWLSFLMLAGEQLRESGESVWKLVTVLSLLIGFLSSMMFLAVGARRARQVATDTGTIRPSVPPESPEEGVPAESPEVSKPNETSVEAITPDDSSSAAVAPGFASHSKNRRAERKAAKHRKELEQVFHKQSIIQCRECGLAVSKNANMCPSCGTKRFKPEMSPVWSLLILVVIMGIALPPVLDIIKAKIEEWPVSPDTEADPSFAEWKKKAGIRYSEHDLDGLAFAELVRRVGEPYQRVTAGNSVEFGWRCSNGHVSLRVDRAVFESTDRILVKYFGGLER